ncbi:MAG: helicase-related protein [Myxococcota bacterium]
MSATTKAVVTYPVDGIRDAVEAALVAGPVVLTAPTGSGKSTMVPQWCSAEGCRVVVVEPRRVACRALAVRVAELLGEEVGATVGFVVRDAAAVGATTRIRFVTPGIALRRLEDVLAHDVVVVDELHERGMEVDLLLALLRARYRGRLVVMSATMNAERVATYLSGRALRAEGRRFPVAVEHLYDRGQRDPDAKGLEARVQRALEATEGDTLVFLPGKREIAAVGAKLSGRSSWAVMGLHGGLTLAAQSEVFRPAAGRRRKVVLTTNVAETSVTVPGIAVVVDSGLVRRTRYHRGRGFLTLTPIARDSAEQRAGRAGRTGPGRAVRLWHEAAPLAATTPPEIHRESLLPLLLAAAASDQNLDDLTFLDPPPAYAVAAARAEAVALGAVAEGDRITSVGRELFGLPLDAPLGRLVVQARGTAHLDDAIDLVAGLATPRPLFAGPPPGETECDATAMIGAVRGQPPYVAAAARDAVAEARQVAKRLRRAFGGGAVDPERACDRLALARIAIAADPRSAHVARARKRRVGFSHGATEIELGRRSAALRADRLEAIVVYETRALGVDARKTQVVATCVTPVPLRLLAEAGLGRERVGKVSRVDGELRAEVERVYAGRVIHTRQTEPQGALAREAVATLVARGSLFRAAREVNQERMRARTLAARLAAAGLISVPVPEETTLRDWLVARLEELGLESGDDLALLETEDLTAPEVPWDVQQALDTHYPSEVRTPEARFAVELDVEARTVTLRFVAGQAQRRIHASSVPRFAGFDVVRVDTGHGLYLVRDRR